MNREDIFDAVIVGAGFAGLYMLYRLREQGFRVKVFEAGEDVGGTWFWNCYPDARCDVESIDYSYSFNDEIQQEWNWTETYARQPEILKYIHFVADRLDLRKDVQLNTRVVQTRFSPADSLWSITTDRGEKVRASFCIMATGCLSSAKLPEIEGLNSFKGGTYHTGYWPKKSPDFSGLRVGVIGTGSTAIQAIPAIAQQAAHLYVFQRTASYAIQTRSVPLETAAVEEVKRDYAALRKRSRESHGGVSVIRQPTHSALGVSDEERQQTYEEHWRSGGPGLMRAFNDIMVNEAANKTAADFVRARIREIVKDSEVAELLCPTHFIGTKRICLEMGYFETFNRDNVELVDVRSDPIVTITPNGLRTQGREFELDALVFATGFDAMTGSLLAIDIGIEGGPDLRNAWAEGPRAYLGLMVAGFPNLFTMTGPGSPSVLSNVVMSIEQHAEFIADCLAYMRSHGKRLIEAQQTAQDSWVQHVSDVANMTLMPKAASWYMGANVPGKPRVFMPYPGGVGNYRLKCQQVVNDGYTGFAFSP
ncbi:MAG TPA: NAD(P)/FAD-dependent oxidoreductase [Xanthobacteraceae bacterium]